MSSGLASLGLVLLVQAAPPLPTPPPGASLRGLPFIEGVLRTLSEPNLPVAEQPQKVVRVVVVPPFPQWRLVVTRVALLNGAIEINTKAVGDWYPGPGKVTTLPTRRLPADRWNEIEELLRPGLWSYKPEPFPNPNVVDGSDWYAEASGPRGHLAVVQHAPGNNPFRKLCRAVLWLSNLDFSDEEFIHWFAGR